MKVLAQLDHPNVVRLLGAGTEEEPWFMVSPNPTCSISSNDHAPFVLFRLWNTCPKEISTCISRKTLKLLGELKLCLGIY